MPKYSMDLLDEIKLFFLPEQSNDIVRHTLTASGKNVINHITVNASNYCITDTVDDEDTAFEKQLKRKTKHALYVALKAHFNKQLPWGSLTGVRPSKLAYEFLYDGGVPGQLSEYLIKNFDVTSLRADMIKQIIENQTKCLGDKKMLENRVNLYIHVPFCPSRCNYCSFPSAVIKNNGINLSAYVECLVQEINDTLALVKKQGKSVYSVYIGGGTPAVLSAADIKRLLQTVGHLNVEKTFEAGRPDSINTEKLETIKLAGVTRICINPQTLNDDTLFRIGRKHASSEFFEAFGAAKQLSLDINTDIIAGLDGESAADFEKTLTQLLRLSPENITVHTLSRKRASENAEKLLQNDDIYRMMDLAAEYIPAAGYTPYYLYKQKYMLGNLENIGYCRPGKECHNNITVMEELLPVYACGAGAISKSITDSGSITRYQNAKDVKLYVEEFDIRTAKKYKILSNQFTRD